MTTYPSHRSDGVYRLSATGEANNGCICKESTYELTLNSDNVPIELSGDDLMKALRKLSPSLNRDTIMARCIIRTVKL